MLTETPTTLGGCTVLEITAGGVLLYCPPCLREFTVSRARFDYVLSRKKRLTKLCQKCGRPQPQGTGTVGHLVMLAIRQLHERGDAAPTKELIAVTAWQLNPKRLGLRGFEHKYPDGNRVTAELVKMVNKFCTVERVSKGRYRLSDKGWNRLG